LLPKASRHGRPCWTSPNPTCKMIRWASVGVATGLMRTSDALGVKLGHRRVSSSVRRERPHRWRRWSRREMADPPQRLQREIANSRSYEADRLLASSDPGPSPGRKGWSGTPEERAYPGTSDATAPPGPVGKRKYQRHPKVCQTEPNDIATVRGMANHEAPADRLLIDHHV
jgi:hypothetical protein